MIEYIDVHTHQKTKTPKVLSIKNTRLGVDNEQERLFPHSIGIHPWDAHLFTLSEAIGLLNKLYSPEHVVAIGECGIDHSFKIDLKIQIEIFELQIEYARSKKLPLIIHSTRAYSDIHKILRNHNFDLPIIFHAFNGSEQLINQLMDFDSYFSIGDSLIKQVRLQKLRSIKPERLFLETDDSTIEIEKVYSEFAKLSKQNIDELKNQLLSNFRSIFNLDHHFFYKK